LAGGKRRTNTKVKDKNEKIQTNSVTDWRSGTDETSIE